MNGNGHRPEFTIQERFEEYHRLYPELYAYVVALAFELWRKGWQHYGIRPLCEVARYHLILKRKPEDDDVYKLNDHYLSRYARKIMAEFPELEGFFELRRLRTP